jgi:hypothetical protein
MKTPCVTANSMKRRGKHFDKPQNQSNSLVLIVYFQMMLAIECYVQYSINISQAASYFLPSLFSPHSLQKYTQRSMPNAARAVYRPHRIQAGGYSPYPHPNKRSRNISPEQRQPPMHRE